MAKHLPESSFELVETTPDRRHFGVTTRQAFAAMLNYLEGSEVFAFDWETTPWPFWDNRFAPLGLALAADSHTSFYIPVGHRPPKQRRLFDKSYANMELSCIAQIEKLTQDATLVAHNVKFDAPVSAACGWQIKEYKRLYDTYIAAALTNTTQERRLGLKPLTEAWLDRTSAEIGDIARNRDKPDLTAVPLEQVVKYAGDDACNAFQLYEVTKERLEGSGPRVNDLFHKLEMPVVQITAKMEERGVLVNTRILEDIHKRALEIETRTLQQMRDYIGFPFDPGNYEHVHTVLYDLLGIPPARKGGKDTAEKNQLKLLFEIMPKKYREKARPFFQAFIDYKEANKIRTTYTHSLIEHIATDGRLHAAFLQVNAASGRYTSREPNFQNIPRDSKLFDVRSAFVPDDGYAFILADYRQMEFKIAAAFSEDPFLVTAANDSSIDVHVNTARAMFNLSPDDQVSKDQRDAAKTMTYAVQYGANAFAVSKLLMISEKKATVFIRKFFEAYPGLERWIKKARKEIMMQGYVETYYGRRRYARMDILKSPVERLKDEEFRKLVNTRVQGTGADVVKIAMKQLDRLMRRAQVDAQIVGQIHDELVILCRRNQVGKVKPLIHEAMVNPYTKIGDVPLPIDVEVKTSLSKSKAALIPELN